MSIPVSPVVTFSHADLGYSGQAVLSDVNLRLQAGELVGLVGRSGAGKSTLLAAMTGEQVQIRGEVVVTGSDPRHLTRPVGLVPQLGDEVLTHLSITEVVALGSPRLGLFTSRREKDKATALLERLGLGGMGRRRLNELSGGQRQRVAIARALYASDALLLCDEPTSGADPVLTGEIMDALTEVAAMGTTVVIATHDLTVVAPRLTRLVGVGGGVICYDGTVSGFREVHQSAVYGHVVVTDLR